MTLAPGSRLGPFEILAPLGAGGMGEVFRAIDPRLQREIAIKVLPVSVTSDPDALARFEREARAASALNHPNIVTVYDVGREGDVSYLAMELVDGRSLREILRDGPMALKKVLQIATQIADGIAAAHDGGIVHRDLKPENVMVGREGRVKLLDFGLATASPLVGVPEDVTLSPELRSGPRVVLGTVSYMSPEQASGRPVDFRSDQFALGALLWEMVAGRRAFQGETPMETITAVIRDEPESLATLKPATPHALRWVIERCLSKEPEERYASTRDLARDMKHLSARLSESSSMSGGIAVGPVAPSRRDSVLRRVGVVLVALVAGFLAGRIPLRVRLAAPPLLRYLTYSGRDRDPVVSPDGRMLAFTSDRDGTARIWLKQLPGGAEVALTSGFDASPRFSPDGTTLLFTRTGAGRPALFRVPVVGGEPRKVMENAAYGDLSPDGGQLAFLRIPEAGTKSQFAVMTASADGGSPRELYRGDGFYASVPHWSPNGKRLAVAFGTGGVAVLPWNILLLDADGTGKRTLTPPKTNGRLSDPVWLSSREIAYAQQSPISGEMAGRFVRQDIESGRFSTFFQALNVGSHIAIVGPGAVVFDALFQRENLIEIPLLPGYRPGEGTRWLARGNASDRQPVYAADGERIAFSSNRGGNLDLWDVSTRTGAVRRLTEDDTEHWDPLLAPDGKSLLFSSRRSGVFEIWRAEPEGLSPRQLSKDGTDAENPTMPRSSDWIVYGSYQGPKAGIWKMRPDGSEVVRIFEGTISTPEVSPDGQYVVFNSRNTLSARTLRVVRLADGAPAPFELTVGVTNPRAANNVVYTLGRCRWTPDGKAIAFVGQDEHGRSGIYLQDFTPGADTSKTRRLLWGGAADRDTESFGFSPDGKRLVVATVEQTSSLMAVDGLPELKRPAR
jgi:serine/threonine protein kinase/Tol biopolymer transport system component